MFTKFFCPHEFQKGGKICIQKVHSSENLVDMFTKSLPTSTFKKYVHKIGIAQARKIIVFRGATTSRCTWFGLEAPHNPKD